MIRQRLHDDRGQTIFLAPIALIIVVLLGTVTLEVAAMHLRQRQLDDLADSLANDAATVGFDVDAFRTDSTVLVIDPGRASSVLAGGIAISNLPTANAVGGVSVTAGAEPEAAVTITYVHEFILGKAVFGATTTLTATGEAALVRSDQP